MSLDNLVGKTLERIDPDTTSIQRLLAAAARNIQDARIMEVSAENRFDMAYKAIMQTANAVLQANGYRALTSASGHHRTMIQALPLTIGLEHDAVIVIDGLRKQRNVIDYSGDTVSESMTDECIALAEELLDRAIDWAENNPSQ